jgi:hypothetical protein
VRDIAPSTRLKGCVVEAGSFDPVSGVDVVVYDSTCTNTVTSGSSVTDTNGEFDVGNMVNWWTDDYYCVEFTNSGYDDTTVSPVYIPTWDTTRVCMVLGTNIGCCEGKVGDANGSGEDAPTIGDIAAMIDALFISSTCEGVITCFTEADVNQSGGFDATCVDITIGDVSYLIDYLFIAGPMAMTLPDCM